MEKKELLEELINGIFPSKGDNGIEHVDFTYKTFIKKLRELAS